MHRKTYINNYLKIKVFTNSKRIARLVDNFLDFGNDTRRKPRIAIEFHLNEDSRKKPGYTKKIFYRHWFDENKNLTSFFGGAMATTTTNPRTGIVHATIVDYQESFKEGTLDFIFTHPLRFILSHHGLFFVHAAVVCKGSDCVIISGPQNSGKSTVSLTLAQNGFSFLADDDCFFKLWENRIRLFPFPTKMGLHDTIIDKYPKVNKCLVKNYRYGKKRRFSFSSVYGNHGGTEVLGCKTILFPKHQAANKVYARKILKDEALARLARENSLFYSMEKIQSESFWALHNLTRSANAYEFFYNDKSLNKIPEIVNKIF
ncbi:MAG: hypothetical protein PHV55_05630 [Candidatus Omnitrophica bacterium]|nr:hypothetical protein [Candidatus Omnitrophota bacterium]